MGARDDGGSDENEVLSADERARWAIGADGWWGSASESPAELVQRMAGLPPVDADVIPFQHPRLLDVHVVRDLSERGGLDPVVLAHVADYSRDAYRDALEWPFGVGPIEKTWLRASRRIVSIEQAMLEAEAIGRRGDMIAPYARAVARWTVQRADEQESDVPLELAQLLLAAAEAATPGTDTTANGWTAWRWAAHAFAGVASASLMRVPDEALYAQARALISRSIAWAEGKGPRERGLALSELGRFLLDPYAAGKPAERYDIAYALWRERARPGKADAGNEPMPTSAHALRESADALREAIGLLDGHDAAVAWKALVQALHTLAAVDPDAVTHGASDEDIVAASRSALERISPRTHGHLIPYIQIILAGHENRISAASEPQGSPPEQEESLGSLAERVTRREAIMVGRWRSRKTLDHDPALAAAILAEAWELAAEHEDEELRRDVMRAQLALLAYRLPDELRDPARPLADRVSLIEATLATASPADACVMLLGLSVISGMTNEEELGLELVGQALDLDPGVRERIPAQLTYLIADLRFGHACTLGNARQAASAIEAYASAASTSIDCGLINMARQCIQRIASMAGEDTSTAIAAVVGLAPAGLKFGRRLGRDTNMIIAQILRASSAQLTSGPIPNDLLVLRDELAKGLMLGAAIESPTPLSLDAHGRQLLGEIAVLEREAAASAQTAGVAGSALDDEDMLASFVAPSEATPGRSPAEATVNLKRTFDEHVATELYGQAGSPAWATADQLRSLLGGHALLLSIYLGAVPDGRLAVHVQALTRDSHESAVIPLEFPAGLLTFESGGVRLTQSPLGVFVSDLRRRIQEDPLFDAVDGEAGSILERWLPAFLGPFAEQLPRWRAAGLDHLVVWPQGPLHYLPWHLFHDPATRTPLADDWVVTVLPTAWPPDTTDTASRHRAGGGRLRRGGPTVRPAKRSIDATASAGGRRRVWRDSTRGTGRDASRSPAQALRGTLRPSRDTRVPLGGSASVPVSLSHPRRNCRRGAPVRL